MPTYPLTGTAAAEVEARLAVMRLGQTRLGFMDPLVRISIAGTDRSSLMQKGSLRVSMALDEPATVSFETIWDPSVSISEGQVVVIGIGSITNRLFAGHVIQISQMHDPRGLLVRFGLACQDYSWLLDKQQVFHVYQAQSIVDCVSDVVLRYASGFTTTHVAQSLGAIDSGTPFTMQSVMGVLRRIASSAEAHLFVDPIKDVHMFVPNSTNTTFNPHPLTSAYRDFENLTLTTDLSTVKTRVYVEGAGSILSGYGGSGWSGGSITLDSAANFPDPGEEFDIRVGSYGPVDGRRLRYQRQSTVTQVLDATVAGDSLYTDYTAQFPFPNQTPVNLWRIIEDTTAQTALAALDGSDGVREMYVQDRRLSWEGMLTRGNAELAKWKNPVERLTYRTHDPNTRPGGVVTVSLGSPISISGEFVIQRVTVTDFETARYRHPWYTVEASSTRRTLLDILQDSMGKSPKA
jgi:hypothetical protein